MSEVLDLRVFGLKNKATGAWACWDTFNENYPDTLDIRHEAIIKGSAFDLMNYVSGDTYTVEELK